MPSAAWHQDSRVQPHPTSPCQDLVTALIAWADGGPGVRTQLLISARGDWLHCTFTRCSPGTRQAGSSCLGRGGIPALCPCVAFSLPESLGPTGGLRRAVFICHGEAVPRQAFRGRREHRGRRPTEHQPPLAGALPSLGAASPPHRMSPVPAPPPWCLCLLPGLYQMRGPRMGLSLATSGPSGSSGAGLALAECSQVLPSACGIGSGSSGWVLVRGR